MISQNEVTHLPSEPLDSLTHQRHRFRVVGSRILEEFWRVAVLYLAFRQKRPICKPLRACHQTTVIVNDVLGQMFIRCPLGHQITSQPLKNRSTNPANSVGIRTDRPAAVESAIRLLDSTVPVATSVADGSTEMTNGRQ